MNCLGMRIRELREAHKMTRQELADKLWVSCSSVKMWEEGDHIPRNYMVRDIAKLFGVTSNYILWGEETSVENIIKDKAITKIIVEPRLDKTGYYLQFWFNDGAQLRISDKIMYKNFGTDNFKEIMI